MRKPVCYILPLIGLAMLFAGCADEEVGGEGQTQEEMRLYSSMDGRTEGSEEETSDEETSSATSTAGQAVFLFWDFGDVLSGTPTPNPLYVKKPDKDIDTYKRPNEPYNTGELYPDGNRRVMATGYAPHTLTPGEREDGTDDYEVLTIPEDGYGTTDILTSVEPIVASAALPFDREDGETLQFMHAQSKVTFKAKLAANMGKFIQNVQIKLGGDLIATRVRWNRDKEMYVPEALGESSYTIEQTDGLQLTKENPLEIGSAFIVPEKTELSVTLTVERAEEVNASEWETITFQATLPFDIDRDATKEPWDEGKKDDTLYANEAYTFTIAFGEEGIELVGKKCPWENGGYLIIPIYPLGDTTTSE